MCIEKYNLRLNMIEGETSVDYVKRICKMYYPYLKYDIFLLTKSYAMMYCSSMLKFHSIKIQGLLSEIMQNLPLGLANKLNMDEITTMFLNFHRDLHFDRDDGYRIALFDFSKPFETMNLDINTLFQNTPTQVNLICFIEEQRTPNYNLRTNIELLYKLVIVGKIFSLIGYNMKVIGSDIKINQFNQAYWLNTPYNFDDIYEDLLKSYPTMPFNTINIYACVDFECK